jgi:Tfp pilus assembly protein PilV
VSGFRARFRGDLESGESLLELIIALVLLGTAVIAIVMAIGSSVKMSDINRKQATAASYAKSYAEAIQNAVATSGYTPCVVPSVTPAGMPTGYTYNASVTAYWNGSVWSTGCSGSPNVQRISVTVASSDGRATETLNVTVRRLCLDTGNPATLDPACT